MMPPEALEALEARAPQDHPSPRAVTHWRYVDGAAVLLAGVAAAVGLWGWRDQLGASFPLALSAVAIGCALGLLWFGGLLPRLAVRYYRYELTADAIYTQRGWLTRTRTVVPLSRVQSVKTTAGPIERRMGLTSLVLLTAATSHRIAMLDEEVAAALRDRIGRLARESHDDL